MITHREHEAIEIRGLVHSLTLSRAAESGDRHLVLVDVHPNGSALLDHDDIEGLIAWLSSVIAEPTEQEGK